MTSEIVAIVTGALAGALCGRHLRRLLPCRHCYKTFRLMGCGRAVSAVAAWRCDPDE